MAQLEIQEMDEATEYFVSTCSHVGESEEIDAVGGRRLAWLKSMRDQGLRVKVALLDERPLGFIYLMPVEVCPWGPLGQDLLAMPCLSVLLDDKGHGAGRALIAAAEEEARRQGKKALVTYGYYHDFWFMPATYFERLGFSAPRRRGQMAILWKVFDDSAVEPEFFASKYRFEPVPGKVVVDLYWHTFCGTSFKEALNVREVVAEFGDEVVLNEYCADNPEDRLRHQTTRALFVNGRGLDWGYEAPKEGVREAISEALKEV